MTSSRCVRSTTLKQRLFTQSGSTEIERPDIGIFTHERVFLKNETHFLKKIIDKTEFYTLDFENSTGNSCFYNCIQRGLRQLFQLNVSEREIRQEFVKMIGMMGNNFFEKILKREFIQYRDQALLNDSLKKVVSTNEWQFQILILLSNRKLLQPIMKTQLQNLAENLIIKKSGFVYPTLNVEMINNFFQKEKQIPKNDIEHFKKILANQINSDEANAICFQLLAQSPTHFKIFDTNWSWSDLDLVLLTQPNLKIPLFPNDYLKKKKFSIFLWYHNDYHYKAFAVYDNETYVFAFKNEYKFPTQSNNTKMIGAEDVIPTVPMIYVLLAGSQIWRPENGALASDSFNFFLPSLYPKLDLDNYTFQQFKEELEINQDSNYRQTLGELKTKEYLDKLIDLLDTKNVLQSEKNHSILEQNDITHKFSVRFPADAFPHIGMDYIYQIDDIFFWLPNRYSKVYVSSMCNKKLVS